MARLPSPTTNTDPSVEINSFNTLPTARTARSKKSDFLCQNVVKSSVRYIPCGLFNACSPVSFRISTWVSGYPSNFRFVAFTPDNRLVFSADSCHSSRASNAKSVRLMNKIVCLPTQNLVVQSLGSAKENTICKIYVEIIKKHLLFCSRPAKILYCVVECATRIIICQGGVWFAEY